MAGTSSRSGGKNAILTGNVVGDGVPQSPRVLSPRAETLFQWLLERTEANQSGSAWSRIDGALLASLAEIMQSQETVSSLLADDPSNVGLHRLRNNLATQIARLSAVIGMTPYDRAKQPKPSQEADTDVFQDIMQRMASAD